VINDDGMSIMKGKLYIHFTVEFSDSLVLEQCKAIESVLPPKLSSNLIDMEIDEVRRQPCINVNNIEE
jgi:DnaJ homolog subfamily A member 2